MLRSVTDSDLVSFAPRTCPYLDRANRFRKASKERLKSLRQIASCADANQFSISCLFAWVLSGELASSQEDILTRS